MTGDFGPSDPLLAVLRAADRADGRTQPELLRPELARTARRRWNSFTHRHPAPAPDTLAARVEDLARGLLARCAARAGGRSLIEISDCRELARLLAGVLSEPS